MLRVHALFPNTMLGEEGRGGKERGNKMAALSREHATDGKEKPKRRVHTVPTV